ncbi:adhesin-like protein [Methanobrevibacter arboriphilus JCM 13429 = DSM 1125]|uniref:Adhesin-like protein n=1 Tax=Methanobrevibacter arboriphilus JCM 13429 = DSM 1125 TaxID=1300164 RepID=A0A1V6N1U7_METAZ|nr:hypothetical protein [Methanobrevibacter arboriphilus]OQD58614.1 adhesin-like protein [Methanobrevibacter arboriphilus JCM 13429 = DSM 1125]
MLTINKNHSLILVVLFAIIFAVAISGDVHATPVEPDYNTSGDWVNVYDELEKNLTNDKEDLEKANDTVQSTNKTLNEKDKTVQTLDKKLDTALSNQKKALSTKKSKYTAYKTSLTKYKTVKNNYLKALKKYKSKKTKANKNKVLKAKKSVLNYKAKVKQAKNAYAKASKSYENTKSTITQISSEISAGVSLVNYYESKYVEAIANLYEILDREEFASFEYNNAKAVLDNINNNFTAMMNELYNNLLDDGYINSTADLDANDIANEYWNLLDIEDDTFKDIFISSFAGNLSEIFNSYNGNETFINLAGEFLTNFTNVVMNNYFSTGEAYDDGVVNDYVDNIINNTDLQSAYNDTFNEFVANAELNSNESATNATIFAGQELIGSINDAVNNLFDEIDIAQEKLAEIETTLEKLNASASELKTLAEDGDGSEIASTIDSDVNVLYIAISNVIKLLNEEISKINLLKDFVNEANTNAGSAVSVNDIVAAYNQAVGSASLITKGTDDVIDTYAVDVLIYEMGLYVIGNNVTALKELNNETINDSQELANFEGNLTEVNNLEDDLEEIVGYVDRDNEILANLLPTNGYEEA